MGLSKDILETQTDRNSNGYSLFEKQKIIM